MQFPDTLIKGKFCHLWTILRCPDYLEIPWILWQRGVGGTVHGCLELLWTFSKYKGCSMVILDHYIPACYVEVCPNLITLNNYYGWIG